jgi:hypothetical protein
MGVVCLDLEKNLSYISDPVILEVGLRVILVISLEYSLSEHMAVWPVRKKNWPLFKIKPVYITKNDLIWRKISTKLQSGRTFFLGLTEGTVTVKVLCSGNRREKLRQDREKASRS